MADALERCITDTETDYSAWPATTEMLVDRETVCEDATVASSRFFRRPSPAWVSSAEKQLEDLMRLPEKWDTYSSPRISPQMAGYCVQFLSLIMREGTPAPQIIPTSQGTLQVEWHECGVDLEVEVLGQYHVRVFFEEVESGAGWERELRMNLMSVAEAVQRLECENA